MEGDCLAAKVCYGGLPPQRWRPTGLREAESAALGPTAARRAARARRMAALVAGCRAGPWPPGSWQDREQAARPALRSAAAGLRVAGRPRRRRNAAWHAADPPPRGFARATDEELEASAAGPRLPAFAGQGGPLPAPARGGDGDAVFGDGGDGDHAPGDWRPRDFQSEATAFGFGLMAGWRLAGGDMVKSQCDGDGTESGVSVEPVVDVAGESEAVVVDVRLVVPFQPAAEIDGDGSHVPESVDSGEEPLAELGAVSEVDVEDFLDKMLTASGPEGGAQSVSMEDVVRQIDSDGMDIDRVHAFMSSTRFRQCFRVMGVRIYRVVVGGTGLSAAAEARWRALSGAL
ncbi:unnamed protein product [Prorocentrum cordatum]|uniref:Uncharacterized protein n=1 Tax=Prorocentrum cordatum TaxID=2364126 RepID=A0ABN9T570_9DINO|nr:unnamed protein product [Polarella glacialis]